MSDGKRPSTSEIAERMTEYAHIDGLSPTEYENAMHAVAELTPIFTHDRSCFVLGSYGTYEIRRLQLVKDRLNRETNTYAFLMVDMQGEWYNTIVKFRLLADYVTHIVGVAEHDESGFLVEQGMFVIQPAYFAKTYGLKREYNREVLEGKFGGTEPFSQLQLDIFAMLNREGRFSVWETEDDLSQCAENLL
ncbi:MAG: hypothetical protein IH933_13330 [Euryarchaeota archaeon]|jgi:hypothetical protein|nr:hypothetical protein [Euryarchaeota archaeon]